MQCVEAHERGPVLVQSGEDRASTSYGLYLDSLLGKLTLYHTFDALRYGPGVDDPEPTPLLQ